MFWKSTRAPPDRPVLPELPPLLQGMEDEIPIDPTAPVLLRPWERRLQFIKRCADGVFPPHTDNEDEDWRRLFAIRFLAQV